MVKTYTTTAANRSDSDDIVRILKTLMIDHSLPQWPRRSSRTPARFRSGPADLLVRQGHVDRLVSARRRDRGKGLDHLLTKAKSLDGRPGFVHTWAHDGTVLDPRRDTYDHAFVLLALASVYALDRGAQVCSVVAFRETQLRRPTVAS
jgi:hypothetical protein